MTKADPVTDQPTLLLFHCRVVSIDEQNDERSALTLSLPPDADGITGRCLLLVPTRTVEKYHIGQRFTVGLYEES
jgi:hypothetical protein